MNWFKKANYWDEYPEPAINRKWYHFTFSPNQIQEFLPSQRRKAIYFSDTPQKALIGATVGFRDNFPQDMMQNPSEEDIRRGWMIEVTLNPSIRIYHDLAPREVTPEQYDEILDQADQLEHTDPEILEKMKKYVRDPLTGRPIRTLRDENDRPIGNRFKYMPFVPDWEGFEYEGRAIDALRSLGYDGAYVKDEAGISLAIFSPEKINIVRQYKVK